MQPPTYLNRAEKRLLALTRIGKPARFPQGCILRATVIRALCLKAFHNAEVDPKGIRIVGATIVGVLDLEAVKVEFPLRLRCCDLLQRPTFAGADLKLLDLLGAHCLQGIDATDLKVDTKLLLSAGFESWGEVCLYAAEIGGDLDCRGGSFANRYGVALNAQGAKIGGSALLCMGAPAELGRAEAGGVGCTSRRAGGRAATGSFKAEGEVSLYGAKISGDLVCTDAHFANRGALALNAEGAKIDGAVFLRSASSAERDGARLYSDAQCAGGRSAGDVASTGFVAEGEVRFSRAKIGGFLDCSGGRFTSCAEQPALSAIAADIRDSVYLREAFLAEGEVSLYAAKVGRNLNCGKGRFENRGGVALNAAGVQVGGILFWTGVSTSGQIRWQYASVNQLDDEPKSWPPRGALFLDGFRYSGFHSKEPPTAKERVEWLRRQKMFAPQPYEHLVDVLRRSGHERDARKVAIKKHKEVGKSGLVPKTSRAWNRFLHFTVRHGYRPWRASIIAFYIIVLGWGVFLLADWRHLMAPTSAKVSAEQSTLPDNGPPVWWDKSRVVTFSTALGYSLDVFLPVVNLHQEDQWLPDRSTRWGQAVWAYMWLQILSGWTLTTLLLAALAGVIKKD